MDLVFMHFIFRRNWFSAFFFIAPAALALALCLPAPCGAQTPLTYTISTVAGNGTAGYTGNGGAATSAEFNTCSSVAVDAGGNLYIADFQNNVVRKVSTSGIVTVYAGNGTAPATIQAAGDGGPATSAEFSYPQGVALDSAGNLYITDTQDSVVRKVTAATGIVSLVAGDYTPGYTGDGSAATSAELYTPAAVFVDNADNVYIADTGNNVIRMVTASNGIITTIAGDTTATSLGDGGAATSAQLSFPEAVITDNNGNVYISDSGDDRVRVVNSSGIISTFAGLSFPGYSGDGGLATNAQLNEPKGLALDSSGNLYIADYLNDRIRVVASNGVINTIAGSGGQGYTGDGGPATSADLFYPSDVALGPQGKIYITDENNNVVRLLTPNLPAPVVGTGGVIGASGFGGSASIAPGDWIEIYGTNLASETRGWTAADFSGVNAPTGLSGTSVSIDGLPAYVSFISPGQVNVQVPSGVALGTQLVTVTTASGTSEPVTVNVNDAQPGMLATPLFNVGGVQYVAAILTDFSTFIAPTGSISGITSRPAIPGETIVIYGVGFGSVTPTIPAGQTVTQSNNLVLPLQISFGRTPAAVTYSGLAPDAVGLYQFNVVVPSIPASNAVPLTFTLNGVAGTQTLYTAVQ
jgi:uncharacterized protein (TIGR03437 family)